MIKNNKIVYYMIMLIFIISCKSKDTSYYINNEKMKNVVRQYICDKRIKK